MNYLGVYHSNYPRSTRGICDAPCVSKGRMTLCAADSASEGCLLAMACGRIRNRDSLLNRLRCPPRTSAAELILAAYREWGTDYPKEVEGAVVTCVMDVARDRMVLSRDRMGELPVFYAAAPDGGVVFSDHPDSLLKTASAPPVVDAAGLCELFGLGPARTPGRTPLRDVHSLEPGCMLIGEGSRNHIEAYFALRPAPHLEDAEETIEHTRALLNDAVAFIAPLHPAAMLSGGLDSTALTAMLARQNGRILSFSVDYRDNAEDFRPSVFCPSMDAPFASMASQTFGTEHHIVVLDQAALASALSDAVSARGFPGMADVDSSLLLFAAQIARRAPVVVSGECGDEVFGGYPWFREGAHLGEDAFPWSGSVALRESILSEPLRSRLNLPEYVRRTLRSAVEQTGIDCASDDREGELRRIQLLCFRFFMANLQERAVRMCEPAGLTVLTPLCDERLVQYVFNVPWKMKFMGGMEKGLFRAAVRDLMPRELNERRKSPYPKTCSPIYTEIIRGMTAGMLADRDAPILEWIDAGRVRALAESPLDPAETPWFGQLMAGPQMLAYLLQVNTWMRERNITVSL